MNAMNAINEEFHSNSCDVFKRFFQFFTNESWGWKSNSDRLSQLSLALN
ncbi:hypothetical protein IQ230_00340 [Gloeocapsopsis crepidinum LEGE 06123]|uniref:Transposase n=1 Tax=Gloeocapsopsis crepidinum LEGE 06123 TaxID=588587 RepID=A0ABR9UKM0_9CHRO|nr:hypothetical protein [Gloeocapsopsis crepidinum]MBE9188836.1 hypothetical protein [Gloeocapsopsis crepidinum LEGE 06123]